MPDNKGQAKITIEIEINEPLMEVMKESMTKMPEMIKHVQKAEK